MSTIVFEMRRRASQASAIICNPASTAAEIREATRIHREACIWLAKYDSDIPPVPVARQQRGVYETLVTILQKGPATIDQMSLESCFAPSTVYKWLTKALKENDVIIIDGFPNGPFTYELQKGE